MQVNLRANEADGGIRAIEAEFAASGSDDDKECLQCAYIHDSTPPPSSLSSVCVCALTDPEPRGAAAGTFSTP